jgi:homoserine O-acetyltransferase/O-succinyltransferase
MSFISKYLPQAHCPKHSPRRTVFREKLIPNLFKPLNTQIYHYPDYFYLENGEDLAGLEIAYTTLGQMNADRSNVVWVCHALTANADVADWWKGLVGAGYLFDPGKYFIVCANILGSCYGSSGPLTNNPRTNQPYYNEFPQVTIRDMVNAHELLRAHLGIERIYLGIGGSLGGQQTVEWAIHRPDLFDNLVLIATNARHSAWGIAFNESQRLAIMADPTWARPFPSAGRCGLKAARSIALLSYRNYETYANRQSETSDDKVDDFRASSYQRYQGEKLVKRFNVISYLRISKAFDAHNVGRGRSGVAAALGLIRARTLVVGITSDLLFPPTEQQFLAEQIAGATYIEIDSPYGHDGFLVEYTKLTEVLTGFLSPI